MSIAACRRMPILSARFGGCALREPCLAQRLVLFEHAGAKKRCNYIRRRRASSRVEPNRDSYKIVQPETKPQAIPQPRRTGIRGAAPKPAFPQEICPSGLRHPRATLLRNVLKPLLFLVSLDTKLVWKCLLFRLLHPAHGVMPSARFLSKISGSFLSANRSPFWGHGRRR